MNTEPDLTRLPRTLMISVSFIQGVLLLILYRLLEAEKWPDGDPISTFVLATGLGVIPIFFLLLLDENNLRKSLRCLAAYAVVIIGTAAYSGLQQMPEEFVRNSNLIPVFVLTMGIASFKALMYSQEYCLDKGINYSSLFHYSWRNFLLFCLACLFAGLSIGLLMLWGGLFSLIEVNFFSDLFKQDWFLFPATTTAFGFAVIIFRSLSNIIDSVAKLLKTMIKFLLPVLALVALMFILFLPFTGLQPLWDTRFGSAMMLWLQALLLFSVNGVYQGNSEEQPYPLWMHRLIYAGIATLPIYSIIAFHGIFTRINQYGLTVSRCWAVIVALILACFAFGYLWGIIRNKDRWLLGLAKVNISMGLIVMALMVLVNSPIVNLQSISVKSQIARVEDGKITPDELDLYYFRSSLGRQGYLALQNFSERWGEEYPVVATDIERIYAEPIPWERPDNEEEVASFVTTWPADREVPDFIYEDILSNSYTNYSQYYVMFIDLNEDNQEEIITLFENEAFYSQGKIWTRTESPSQEAEWPSTPYRFDRSVRPPAIRQAIENGDIEIITPAWNNLRIGEGLIVPVDSGPALF